MLTFPATTIYYNCCFQNCTTLEWINTSGGSGDFTDLLNNARTVNTRYLLGLHSDPYMFHQANLRHGDVESFTVGSESGPLSLLQIWVETVTQEMTRLFVLFSVAVWRRADTVLGQIGRLPPSSMMILRSSFWIEWHSSSSPLNIALPLTTDNQTASALPPSATTTPTTGVPLSTSPWDRQMETPVEFRSQ